MKNFRTESGMLIGEFRKNKKQMLRVTIKHHRGFDLMDIRLHYESEGNWLPSRSGITIRLEQFEALLSVLHHAARITPYLGVKPESPMLSLHIPVSEGSKFTDAFDWQQAYRL